MEYVCCFNTFTHKYTTITTTTISGGVDSIWYRNKNILNGYDIGRRFYPTRNIIKTNRKRTHFEWSQELFIHTGHPPAGKTWETPVPKENLRAATGFAIRVKGNRNSSIKIAKIIEQSSDEIYTRERRWTSRHGQNRTKSKNHKSCQIHHIRPINIVIEKNKYILPNATWSER